MKELRDRPTEGQWVEVWEYEGVTWSYVFKIEEGRLYMLNPIADEFVKLSFYYPRSDSAIKYFAGE